MKVLISGKEEHIQKSHKDWETPVGTTEIQDSDFADHTGIEIRLIRHS